MLYKQMLQADLRNWGPNFSHHSLDKNTLVDESLLGCIKKNTKSLKMRLGEKKEFKGGFGRWLTGVFREAHEETCW